MIAPPPLRWKVIVPWALLGAVLGGAMAFLDLARTYDTNGGLLHTGPTGPASALIARDFPDEAQYRLGEHDGPMFYAIARSPTDLDEVAASLDRPRYRLQHPLFSWAARALHPTGGGPGLLRAMVVVGLAALVLGGVAMGALSVTLRGPPWIGVLFGLLPGSVMSVRITVADAMALALALVAVVLYLRGHPIGAAVAAVAAVLTKEPMLLAFAGVVLWRRKPDALGLVVAPVVVAGLWFLWLRTQVPTSGAEVIEFVVPPRGLLGSFAWWVDGESPYAALAVGAALVCAVVGLVRRRPTHPLWFVTALNLGFVLLLDRDVLGLERNGTRLSMPLLVWALLLLATPAAAKVQLPARRATTGAITSTTSADNPT